MEAGVTESAAIVDAGSSGPTDDIKTVDPYQAIKRKRLWRPLDVQRHSEAYQRLTGYILVVLLAMATGALAVVYELVWITPADRDTRDLIFDQRITNEVMQRYHTNFRKAEFCCSQDINSRDNSTCSSVRDKKDYTCPPMIQMECRDVRDSACNSVRRVLYNAMGLDSEGRYVDCSIAGKARVGSKVVPANRPIQLVVLYGPNDEEGQSLVIGAPFNINVTAVNEFVANVTSTYTDNNYAQPNYQLSQSATLEGTLLNLDSLTSKRQFPWGAIPPWPDTIWPWPGMEEECPNTRVNASLYLTGFTRVWAPSFVINAPQDSMLTLQFASDSRPVAAWRMEFSNAQSLSQQLESPWPLPANAGSAGPTQVTISALSELNFKVGMVPQLGNCYGWQISRNPDDFQPVYMPFWNGTLAQLQSGEPLLGLARIRLNLTVTVTDVSGNLQNVTPYYGGMWYIFVAFGAAGIWFFGTCVFLFLPFVIWWNVRDNRGLPPIVYRYMRKYRGW